MALEGQIALVTGASGGIGRAIASALAQAGASVVLSAHKNRADLDAFVAGAPWRDRALTVTADISDPSAVDAAFAQASERFGRVDICVANSGIGEPDSVPLHLMDDARITAVMAVNVLGSIFTARAFLGLLARSGPRAAGPGASLVFIGSTAGRYGEVGHAEYAASKSALGGLMLSLKNEIVALDPRGRVNLVEPGWTRTAMIDEELEADGIRRTLATMPLQRVAAPEDIAEATLFLSSPSARHVTGQFLTVAGGMEGRVQFWPPGRPIRD
jgi:3-oxoacyl-[acyl-carrier protein] reductase